MEHKGIYFDVDDNGDHIALTMFKGFEPENQVCLRDEDLERLIELLQSMRKTT
ncbi:hypothetical protein [Paenibacillus lautus]|uniref:hypothetical protein n=1 Tax=Paenibacillus lautus TaxID=1401 RepID=UPI001C7D47FB|nr:hypothetical protein [Paenibacillus lautus]